MVSGLAGLLMAALLFQDASSAPPPPPAASGQYTANLNFYGGDRAGPAPYELAGGLVVFKMTVAGREAWALLANRSERSLIDEGFAAAAGLTVAPADGTLETPLGTAPKRRVSNVSIIVPRQFEAQGLAVGGVDLKPLSARLGREIAFVIGEDIFDFVGVSIDPRTNEFRMAPSGQITVQGRPPVPLQDGRIDASAAGKPLPLTVDLGFEGTLRVTPAAWARLQGTEPSGPAFLSDVNIGPLTGTRIPTAVSAMPPKDGEAALGMGFLKHNAFALDIRAGRLWFAPLPTLADEAPAAPPAAAPQSGPGVRLQLSIRVPPPEQRAVVPYETPTHIVFRAKVAGRDVWALLDSGFTTSAMDLTLAREAGLAVNPTDASAKSLHGRMPLWQVDETTVLVPGQAEIAYKGLPAIDLKPTSAGLGRPIGLVLGMDLISNAVLVVDTVGKTFRVAPGRLTSPPPGFRAIDLLPGPAGRPRINITVGGQEIPVVIDTGGYGEVSITPQVWASVIPADARVLLNTSGGAEGVERMERATVVPEIELGGGRLRNVAVRRGPPDSDENLLGLGLLSRFRFVLDVREGKLWLAPRPLTVPPPGAATAPPASAASPPAP